MIDWTDYMVWILAYGIIWLWSMYYEHIKKGIRLVLVRLGILRDRTGVKARQRKGKVYSDTHSTDLGGS